MNAIVTPDRAASYDRDGYLIIPGHVFSDSEFAALKEKCAATFAKRAEERGGVQPSLVDCPHWDDPEMFRWIFAPEMLALVEPVIGPDIAVFACHFLQKPAEVGKRVPWHEDSAYWKGWMDPILVASVTVSLETSSTENGCLRVIPGTHANGYSDYDKLVNPGDEVFPTEVKAEQFDESKAVDIVLEPNQASLHDARIIHGSAPNTGTLPRAAFTVRYFPTTNKFDPDFNKNFRVYLAKGVDHAGNPYGDPAKAYPPAGVIP